MYRTLAGAILIAMLAVSSAQASMTIVRDHRPQVAIHIPRDATLQEAFAARELQRYIAQASGAKLAIERGAAEFGKPAIVVCLVGKLPAMGEYSTVAERKLGLEGIGNRVSNNHLIIAGGGPRGIVYSVYNYLESLGYRWFWPGNAGEVTPQLADISADRLRYTHEPSFIRRHAMGGGDPELDLQWHVDTKDWATKNHLNFWVWPVAAPGYKDFMAKRGGTCVKVGSGHNWNNIIPASKNFAEHPDWYPMVNGKRYSGYGQLCLTNPEVLQKLTDYAMKGAQQMARDPNVMFIDMTQNDGNVWCECPNCKAIDDKDPSTHADIVLWAVNQIADTVCAKYPKAVLFTMAYSGSVGTPNWIKPHPNVMIEQANYCFNYGASFTNPNSGRGNIFRQYVDEWSPIAKLHGIYEYFGFYNWLEALPVTLYRLQDEVNYYKKQGINGFYSETEQRWATNHLLYYAFSRLWWDDKTNVKDLMEDFFTKAFGPAHDPMRDFYMTLETSGGPNRYWSGDEFNLYEMYPPQLRAKCRADLDRARQLAGGDKEVTARLDFVEIGWRYTELHLGAMEAQRAFGNQPTAENRAAAMNAWRDYVAFCDRIKGTNSFEEGAYGLQMYRDRGQRQLDAFALDLGQLPAGEVSYSDNYDGGGNASLHGKLEGFHGGPWGLYVSPGTPGSVVYELGARDGHVWKSARVAFYGEKFDKLSNAVEYSLDGNNWQTLAENRAFTYDAPFDISAQVAGAQRFWVRVRCASTASGDLCCLYGVNVTGKIE